jgi:hypothetical protein
VKVNLAHRKDTLHLRLEKLPKASQDISWKAPGRLCKRSRRRLARSQNANQVVGATSRALAAFVWASAREVAVAHYEYAWVGRSYSEGGTL